MTKYLSNRQKELKIGIHSFTEDKTVLDVTGGTYISGNLGIGVTNPQTKLEIDGILGFKTSSSTYGGSTFNNIRIGDSTTGANLIPNYQFGSRNIFIGSGAGYGTTTGISNIFLGDNAGRNNPGYINNFFGYAAGAFSNGSYNNFFGSSAGFYYNGSNNNFFGNNTGSSYFGIGSDNNFFGNSTGYNNYTGFRNNFFGNFAGGYNTTGYENNFFGDISGTYNTTGSRNLYLGTRNGLSVTASNKIIIGSGCTVSIGNNSFARYFDSPDTTKDLQFAVGVRTDSNPSKYWLVGNENFNIGIGTTNPTHKLTVGGNVLISGVTTTSGDLYVGGDLYVQDDLVFDEFTARNANVTGITTLNDLRTSQTYNSGVTTSVGGFVGNLTGTATTATRLQNPRTFEITGDIVASPISFDGTGNVSLAATIQPNSVALGTDTTGDYVQSITGTANQINVSNGSGEGSTPVVSFASNPLIPGNVTIGNDLQVNNNLNVTGNITIGGTAAYIISNDFRVKDADIVLGFTTDSYGNDISNDTTANHGGISIASTEGNPLIQLTNVAIGETTPATYKKIMWFKSGSFAGLNTDAWLINYAVGIGSTQFPSGTRLAAGSVQFTERDLAVVRNINASGIVTANTFRPSSGYIQAADGTNSFYIYSGTGNVAFQGTIGASQINNASGYKVIGFSGTSVTFENNVYISGVTTSVGGFVGNLTGTATTAEVSTSVIGGIASVSQLNVSGISTFSQISAGGTTGSNQYVLSSTGTGLSWQPVTSVGSGTLNGIIVEDEGSIVGTAGSITTLNFVGNNISVSAVPLGLTATITVSDTPNFDTLTINSKSYQGSITTSTSTTSPVGIHSELSIATYRSVEYTIQATEGSNFHATKILALHDGSTSYSSEYGTIFNNSIIATFDVDVSGGNIRLLATPSSSSTTNYVINFIATKL